MMIKKIKDALYEQMNINRHIHHNDVVNVGIEQALTIINQIADGYAGGWIPADDPPEEGKYVLLSFDNFPIPCVGRYDADDDGGAYYLGDEDESLSVHGIFVNAWMPLPERYKGAE